MFGIGWMEKGDSIIRPIALTCVWSAVILLPIITGLYYGLQKPMEEHWAKVDAEIKQKTQAELTAINNMNCQQLHDKLLSTDHFYDSDNEAIARDHYVANCGVRLP